MQKIISLFQRNYDGDRLVRNEVVPGAEWVLVGEGVATRKWDGTSCMVREGKLFKRYDAKHPQNAPAGFIPADEHDPVNRHYLGWLPVGDGPEDKWHVKGFAYFVMSEGGVPEDGTYELVGEGVQGGIEGGPTRLVRHGTEQNLSFPRDFDAIKSALSNGAIEGIVWHHPDGRMVKIKAKDFGIKRAPLVSA